MFSLQPLFYRIVTRLARSYSPEVIGTALTLLPDWMIPLALRHWGARVGDETTIRAGVRVVNLGTLDGLARLQIGSHCYIGFDSLLDISAELVLEDEVTLSPRVMLLTHQDVGQRPLARFFPPVRSRTVLRRGCWIGANATILCGVEIGENAVVGAGAVVRSSVPPGLVVAGVPARPVRPVSVPHD